MVIETTLLEQAYVTEESVTPSAIVAALAGAGAGNVDDGTHSYKVTHTSSVGESAPSAVSNTVTVADKTMDGKIAVTLPTAVAGQVAWKIYRSEAGDAVTGPWLLVATQTVATGTAYVDNLADSGLGAAAPSVSTASDGVYGYGVITEP